jgi:hypothetical protein
LCHLVVLIFFPAGRLSPAVLPCPERIFLDATPDPRFKLGTGIVIDANAVSRRSIGTETPSPCFIGRR